MCNPRRSCGLPAGPTSPSRRPLRRRNPPNPAPRRSCGPPAGPTPPSRKTGPLPWLRPFSVPATAESEGASVVGRVSLSDFSFPVEMYALFENEVCTSSVRIALVQADRIEYSSVLVDYPRASRHDRTRLTDSNLTIRCLSPSR